MTPAQKYVLLVVANRRREKLERELSAARITPDQRSTDRNEAPR